MIVLFTDFGLAGPYSGQMKAVLAAHAPGVPVIDLFADAPAFNPKASAYLLAAHAPWFSAGTVFLGVIDPGVGGPRSPIAVEADGRWFVGPDNGLFELVIRRAAAVRSWEIIWRPEVLSTSFHGRDLFAPVAAWLALGESPRGTLQPNDVGRRHDWPDDLAEIIYIDHYGNAVTGLRAAGLAVHARIGIAGSMLARATTFCDVPPGTPCWYENSSGLAELAVNQGRADRLLGLAIGTRVLVAPSVRAV